jgi:hypothetical protein
MKKIISSIFLFSVLLIPLFSDEKLSFDLTQPNLHDNTDNIFTKNINTLPLINYAKVLTQEQSDKIVKNIEISNMILGIIALTGYTANSIIGPFILAEKFQNQPYENGLLYSHIPVGLASGLLNATVISLGYADIGLRNKYKMGYSKAYAISIFVNTGFAVAEVGLVIANLITSRLNPEAAKWVGLAHAITIGTSLVCLSVQFGLSFSIPEKTD